MFGCKFPIKLGTRHDKKKSEYTRKKIGYDKCRGMIGNGMESNSNIYL